MGRGIDWLRRQAVRMRRQTGWTPDMLADELYIILRGLREDSTHTQEGDRNPETEIVTPPIDFAFDDAPGLPVTDIVTPKGEDETVRAKKYLSWHREVMIGKVIAYRGYVESPPKGKNEPAPVPSTDRDYTVEVYPTGGLESIAEQPLSTPSWVKAPLSKRVTVTQLQLSEDALQQIPPGTWTLVTYIYELETTIEEYRKDGKLVYTDTKYKRVQEIFHMQVPIWL